MQLIKAEPSDRLTAQAAATLALLAADSEASRKKGMANAGAVDALLEYLEDGSGDGKPKVAVAQALANLAVGSSYVQVTGSHPTTATNGWMYPVLPLTFPNISSAAETLGPAPRS